MKLLRFRHILLDSYRWLFARKIFAPVHQAVLRLALKGLGINNYETPVLSGEDSFVRMLASQYDQLVVFDVGANRGSYAKLVKRYAPHAQIYAFEPHPATFQHLARVAQCYPNFTVVPLGCGDTCTTVPLYDYATQQDGSSHASLYRYAIEQRGGTAYAIDVNLTTLDQFTAEQQIARIQLLKIDTEGNELAVLRGAQRLINEHRIDVVQFEFDQMNIFSRTLMHDFYTLLAGYRFYRLLPFEMLPLEPYRALLWEQFAFQNIVAVHPRVQLKHRSGWE